MSGVPRFLLGGLTAKGQLAALAVGAVVLVSAGAAGWDRMPVIGPHAKISGLRADVKREQDLVAKRTGEREAWKAADKACEDQRIRERDQRGTAVGKAEDDKTGARSDAFDQGYAAGRVAGRRQCGATNATDPLSGSKPPGPSAGPVGVRNDLSDSWNAGAYVPPGALPR